VTHVTYTVGPDPTRSVNEPTNVQGCLAGAVVGRRTGDRKVASSTPGRGAIKSTRSTQPSIPPG